MTSFIEGDISENSAYGFDEPFMSGSLSVQGGAVSFMCDEVVRRVKYASRGGDNQVGLVYESLVQELLDTLAQFRTAPVFDLMGESCALLTLV